MATQNAIGGKAGSQAYHVKRLKIRQMLGRKTQA